MFSAQYVQLLRTKYRQIERYEISRLFIVSGVFQDQFDWLFNDSNTIIQFLFYTTNDTMTKTTLFNILEKHNRTIPFSDIYFDESLSTSVIMFIQTLVKIKKEYFIYGPLTNVLALYLCCSKKFTERLVRIIANQTQQPKLNTNEKKLLSCTRVLSIERILEMEDEDTEEDDFFEFPHSNK